MSKPANLAPTIAASSTASQYRFSSTSYGVRSHDDTAVMRCATVCVVIYVVIYTFESPIRYVLYLSGLNALILLRDALLILPLIAILVSDLRHGRVRPAMWLFALTCCIGCIICYLNFGDIRPAALGAKMLLGTLFGIIAGAALIVPGARMGRLLLLLWAVTVLGVVLEKFFVNFPWVGLHAMIGNINVELSRDWQVVDSFQKRVGGFTRMSIAAAGLMPLLSIVVLADSRSFLVRNTILLVTIGAVFLTTQKGALLATVLVWAVLLVPQSLRIAVQIVTTLLCLLVDVSAPLLTYGMKLPVGDGGSYSASSLADRIMITWPASFDWIARREIFPFGVGLGGIGEAQRFVPTNAVLYPDNLFLFLLSSFGVLSLGFFGLVIAAVLRAPQLPSRLSGTALSILIFITFYGTFVSIIEDQMESLFLGAALGALLTAHKASKKALIF